MGRRTSGQQVGFQSIGNVQANAATLTTTQPNSDLTLDPNGSGTVQITADVVVSGNITVANQSDLRLREGNAGGTNYIAQQASAAMAADYTITWPAAKSTVNGFALTSDTNGNLSWSSAGGGIPVTDPGSTATVHYPFFGTATGSLPTTLVPNARTNLSFVPSTGDLEHAVLSGGTANGATVTIRGTRSATKAAASVLLNDGVASSSTTTGTLVVTGGMGISGDQYLGGTIYKTVAGTTSGEVIRGQMADNDFFRILMGGTGSNSGFLEIATSDDGDEPIHVRQYSGVFTTLTRTATLLNGSGNTSFPGTVTANVLTATSDERTKQNIETLENALQKTLALRGVSFNRIGSDQQEIGVIAQETELTCPQVVSINEDTGYKAVAYGNLTALLIEAIKEQQQQIAELQRRLV